MCFSNYDTIQTQSRKSRQRKTLRNFRKELSDRESISHESRTPETVDTQCWQPTGRRCPSGGTGAKCRSFMIVGPELFWNCFASDVMQLIDTLFYRGRIEHIKSPHVLQPSAESLRKLVIFSNKIGILEIS